MRRRSAACAAILAVTVLAGVPAGRVHAQEQQRQAREVYQLTRPIFVFRGEPLRSGKLPEGELILVAGAEENKDIVHVFADSAEFMEWAQKARQAEVLIRATREMNEAAIRRDAPRGLPPRNVPREPTPKDPPREPVAPFIGYGAPELGEAEREMGGVGWIYAGQSYSGISRPMAPYPNLSWLNINNNVESAWVVGFAILCDGTWYSGAKVYLLGIGIQNLGVFGFNNRASSVWF
jgi:hypothetical protein